MVITWLCPEIRLKLALLKVRLVPLVPPLPTCTITEPQTELLPLWQIVMLAVPFELPLIYRLLPETVAGAAVGFVLPDKV